MNAKLKPVIRVSPPGPRSLAALDRLQGTIGRGNYMGLYGITIAGCEDLFLTDLDGNIYLDCISGAASTNIGYDFHAVAEAYHDTALAFPHTCFSYSPSEVVLELAETLFRITPGTFSKKVLFSLSGSRAFENALEVMWQYTRRQKIIVFEHAYHGATWLAQWVSGFHGEKLGDFYHRMFAPLPYPSSPSSGRRILADMEKMLAAGDVAGVVIEPIQGDAGVICPPDTFFVSLAALLKRYGVLLAVDEIQNGMGRTGKWWSIEHYGIIPDLIIMGKALAGGYAPVSALVGRAGVIDSMEPGKQIGTFIGHPPSSAAALGTIRVIEENGLIDHVAGMGTRLVQGLGRVRQQFPSLLKEVRGKGLLVGLEIDTGKDENLGKYFAMRCVEKGLYIGFYGVRQNVLRISPPLTIQVREVDFIIGTIRAVAREFLETGVPEATREKVARFAIGLTMTCSGG
ncbi:MAG: aminotransferase class III-fold pyridoxal phosphate-dependent enzyme [Desulfobacteraceae bacterium]|nr:aminotransferase class III-fold pyridoxal phosphate-dependent enzyme [Desulfobacteraceae bacterium]